MGRPRKIRELTGLPFRTDRELVYDYQHCKAKKKQEALEELWEKYFLLRMKMKHELEALCRRNNLYMPEIFEEYDSECWIKFVEQMDGIRLEDVEHLPNWSVYIRLWGYWRSMNRDLLKHWFDWKKKTIPVYSLSGKDDKEGTITNLDMYEAEHNKDQTSRFIDKKNAQEIFWKGIEYLRENLTQKEFELINLRQKGVKNSEICQKLKINNKILKEVLEKVHNQLKYFIEKQAVNQGLNFTYEEFCEVLQ